MRILVVSATGMEIAPLVAALHFVDARGSRANRYTFMGHDVTVLTTGVGMVPTASWCSHVLAKDTYDVALNLGACGSFDRSLEPGTLVHVVSDRIAELGAEDGDRFITIQELSLLGENEFPFAQAQLINRAPPSNPVLNALVPVRGITVSTVHGNEDSIAKIVERWNPDVESMEGAAFMYSCLTHDTVFSQVRAVSNLVERRDRGRWRMAEAIAALGQHSLDMLSSF